MPYKLRLLRISPLQGPKSYSSANPNLQFALGAFIGPGQDEYGHRPGFIGTSGFTEGTCQRTGISFVLNELAMSFNLMF